MSRNKRSNTQRTDQHQQQQQRPRRSITRITSAQAQIELPIGKIVRRYKQNLRKVTKKEAQR